MYAALRRAPRTTGDRLILIDDATDAGVAESRHLRAACRRS
jgi:hypothetical protein